MNELLTQIDLQDRIALLFFVACWVGYSHFVVHESQFHKSLLAATNEYRRMWMRQMLKRDNRSVDAIVIGNLMRSVTFSANTTIFILAGLIGMLSYHDKIADILHVIPFAKPMNPMMWELKIFLLIIIFIYAFFKYTWSLRQQTYTSIFVAAAPAHDEPQENKEAFIIKGGVLAGKAAEHFNNGLRAYYFGLAALSWFIHPYLFMAMTVLVVGVIHRREFHSATLKNFLE